MRRNHNRKISPELKLSTSISAPMKRDKHSDAEVKRVGGGLSRIFKTVGVWLRKLFWGSPTLPTFQKPEHEFTIVPSKVIKKRKALRQMQRDSRRANRSK